MNWTEEQVREVEQRMKGGDALRHQKPLVSQARNAAPAKDVAAGAKKTRGPNKWETEYSYELEARKRAGEIVWWGFEALKLRLADATTYSPDFIVVYPGNRLQFVEIKGFEREDAIVKFKVAAEMFPFAEFLMLRKNKVCDGGGWLVLRRLNVALRGESR